MDTRDRYHAQVMRNATPEQLAAVIYLAGGDPDGYVLDGVLPDGDLYIYCDHGRAYYRVTRWGGGYRVTERRVNTPTSMRENA